MPSLREAATQALEALEEYKYAEARDALRAALAEPVQESDPGVYHGWVVREVLFDNGEPVGHREPVQEPVGVVTSMVKGGVTWHRWPSDMPDGTTLYTSPPQRKPLTEEEIDAIPCTDGDGSDWDALVRFARAIERAHGIGGEA